MASDHATQPVPILGTDGERREPARSTARLLVAGTSRRPDAQLAEIEARIARWLGRFALASNDTAGLLAGFAGQLVALGLPLMRVAAGSQVFHPLYAAKVYYWRRDLGVEREDFARDVPGHDGWETSPFRQMVSTGAAELRRTLGSSYHRGEFPLLDRLVREGCTDYLAFRIGFAPEATLGQIPGVLVSFQTDRAGGFTEAEADLARALALHYAHAYKTLSSVHAGRVLMRTYLGADPSRRVLDGAIARGQAETVQAVLWYSDLEGFTRIADTAAPDALIGLLNAYADCLVTIIAEHRGEVLKFMGDGILAMFPLGDDSPCARALDAAEAALGAVDRLARERAAEGLPCTGIHLALHVGEVLYGNIGSRERLDFTVVGPAVNEVARIEAMCRQLEQRVVTSTAFAQAAGEARSRLVSLGRYALRGVRRPEELFTIDPESGDAAH
ncbi:adenylate/guanylate cyclase domain-containing protein [Benzoatithermus flavus]|uniref:Adenylate/guanylate cyclase domain-containing protein n=1 Tax=Benzoatithermus flavus TaxID=3108223 RepID=A0ABU8XKQ6_9PROT